MNKRKQVNKIWCNRSKESKEEEEKQSFKLNRLNTTHESCWRKITLKIHWVRAEK